VILQISTFWADKDYRLESSHLAKIYFFLIKITYSYFKVEAGLKSCFYFVIVIFWYPLFYLGSYWFFPILLC
jgi:hypothetical protein